MTQPTPPGWYSDPSGAPGQRYWDGSGWTEHRAAPSGPALPGAPKRKGNTALWVTLGVVVLFFGGCAGLAALGSTVDKPAIEPSPTSAVALPAESKANAPVLTPAPLLAPAATPAAPITPAVAPVGSSVRDGKFEFQVRKFGTSKTAGEPGNQFMEVTAQGVFVIVDMQVTNIGNEPQKFFASNQKLHIGDREYDTDTMAAVWSKSATVDINPGNTVDVTIAYDVPAGTATVDTLEVHDSMFSGGALVALG